MSDMEFVRGKLKSTNKTLEQFFDNSHDIEDLDEHFYDLGFYKTHIVLNDIVWEFIEKEELDSCGDSRLVKNPDGTMDFLALWYNGGGCLSEVIEGNMNE